MKSFFVMFAVLTAAAVAKAQSLGGGGGGSRPTMMFAASPMECVEGSRERFQIGDVSGRWTTVLRTCENGRFFPKQETTPLRCKDGKIEMMTWEDPQTRRREVIPVVCLNGKFRPWRR